jgi:NADPH2:quinone reductase
LRAGPNHAEIRVFATVLALGAGLRDDARMLHVDVGPAEELRVIEGGRPEPTRGEVLIEVHAAGVNRPDILQRKGGYAPPPGASPILGLEVAGRVTALGAGVTTFAVGDEVCALLAGGGYAEYCVAPVPQVLPVPRGCTMLEAAAIPETFFTVWNNVFVRAGLHAGENFLVHGGTSGIGTTAIQLARAFGANVFTTAGSDAKCAACEALGAKAINYRTHDFVAELQAIGRGMDVILDMVGGDYVARNLAVLAPEGRIAQIAFLRGNEAAIPLAAIMQKRATLTGSTLRPRSVAEKGALAAALREKVWPLLESKAVRVIIDRVYPLADVAAAHARMESSEHIGKIVLSLPRFVR